MDMEPARCRKCGTPVAADRKVVFPKAGGVEHLDCAHARKPLARVTVEPPASRCLVCDQPVLPDDRVAMVGHHLPHARCLDHPKAIGGSSGPSARRSPGGIISDAFARLELVMISEAIRLDAADARAARVHMRGQRSRGEMSKR